jgi:hypothetical protein
MKKKKKEEEKKKEKKKKLMHSIGKLVRDVSMLTWFSTLV